MSTILIIDDEPGIRTVLSGILEDEKYNVLAAADGYAGLAAMRDNDVDLVILDVLLPNLGGIDVLKTIKEEYSDTEVIVISGHANIDIAVRAVKLGAFDFVEKPLSMDKIINLVRNALRIEDLKRENKSLKNTLYMEDKMVGNSPAAPTIAETVEAASGREAT